MENFVNNKNAKIFDKDEYMNSISIKTEKLIFTQLSVQTSTWLGGNYRTKN